MQNLLCPSCRRPLPPGSFLSCPACGGMAMGSMLLRDRLSPAAFAGIWQAAHSRGRTSDRLCPSCQLSMAEVEAPGIQGDPVFLDLCVRCMLVWLDRQEIDCLPKARPAPPPPARPVRIGAALGSNSGTDVLDVSGLAILEMLAAF